MLRSVIVALVVSSAGASAQVPSPPGPRPMMMRRMAPPPPAVVKGDSADVPITLTRGPIVSVTIAGKGPFRFLVDTGAGGHLRAGPAVVSALALQSVGEMPAPGGAVRQRYRIDGLALGGVTFSGIEAISTGMLPPDLDGIVGRDLLRDFTLTIDYAKSRLRLDRAPLPASGPGIVATTLDGMGITLPIKVGAVELPVHLDTGNSVGALIVPKEALAGLKTKGEARAKGTGRSAFGPVEMFALTLDAPVSVGGVTLPIGEVAYPAIAQVGNLGSHGLAGHVLTVDQKNARVRISR